MIAITLQEVADILFMTFAIGFIFSDIFRREPLEGYDPLAYYKSVSIWSNIKFAAMIAAPAIVLHELAHKFVALGFGTYATIHAPYTIYILVILLKLVNFPFLFFVGGYVTHGPLPPIESAAVSIAGPLMNLAIWFVIWLIIHFNLMHKKYDKILEPMAKLNMFLFVFNLVPIPGFDGFNFLESLYHVFFP